MDDAGDKPWTLDSVLATEELNRRPPRAPNYRAESDALVKLLQVLTDAPGEIMQSVTDVILDVTGSGSSGISLLTEDGQRFYWPSVSGVWQPHTGGGTPRDFGPCADVLDRDVPLLFDRAERRYPYLRDVSPAMDECLLVPFHVDGKAVGTIWAVTHRDANPPRRFDREDLRIMLTLAPFAAAAFQTIERARAIEVQSTKHVSALREMNDALLVSATQQHELADNAERATHDLMDSTERKNEFLAMLAHELRNPLAPIRNALEIMRLTPGDQDVISGATDVAERQVDQMVRLVDDLLDVSRVSRGRMTLQTARIELASAMHHAVRAATAMVERKGQHLTVSLPDEPIYLNADPVRLGQVLANLLNNASKYSHEGSNLGLTFERSKDNAIIRVRDDGIGIAPDKLLSVFEMFMQVDTAPERAAGGLGIGLTLVKTLVELHGGSIEAHSDGIGHGSEFVICLPALGDMILPVATEPAPDRPSQARRVLIVDDNRDAASSLALVLKLTGHTTRTGFDGEQAVAMAATFRPDVLLLDIGLPKMNGYDACREIRQQPHGKEILMVALTGWGNEEDQIKSRAAGFDHHLMKPVDHAVLARLLADLTLQPA